MKEEIKEERVDQTDSEWKPQEGAGMWLPTVEEETLIGTVEDIVEGIFGNQYLIKPVGKEDSVLTPSHKALVARMVKVRKGDTIKLVYKKEEPPTVKGHNPTKIYEVFIKK